MPKIFSGKDFLNDESLIKVKKMLIEKFLVGRLSFFDYNISRLNGEQ